MYMQYYCNTDPVDVQADPAVRRHFLCATGAQIAKANSPRAPRLSHPVPSHSKRPAPGRQTSAGNSSRRRSPVYHCPPAHSSQFTEPGRSAGPCRCAVSVSTSPAAAADRRTLFSHLHGDSRPRRRLQAKNRAAATSGPARSCICTFCRGPVYPAPLLSQYVKVVSRTGPTGPPVRSGGSPPAPLQRPRSRPPASFSPLLSFSCRSSSG